MKTLESRLLLSATIPQRDGIVWHPNPPRTGGIAIQSGSVLSCFVGQPTMNAVQVTDDGRGHVKMSWNFGQPQEFAGVTKTVIQAQRARTDQFTFHLSHGDTVTAVAEEARSTFHQPGPSTGSAAIELGHDELTDSGIASAGSRPMDLADLSRIGGHFVQSGSLLTIIVNRPVTNIVKITNCVAGAHAGTVDVEWNGRMEHSFNGVATIVVDTHNARKDQVTLTDSTS
jgi:hypothetical protein